MVTQITQGVKISVETMFQPEYSNPLNDHFMFSYKINIENMTDDSVQLISRHWYIFDSIGTHREVIGEGVVGLQPVIEPGSSHEYVSGCDLKTEIGYMKGTYSMKRLADGDMFEVEIPAFQLISPARLN